MLDEDLKHNSLKKTAQEVPTPSAANNEGIAALHNVICTGHIDIVPFLVVNFASKFNQK